MNLLAREGGGISPDQRDKNKVMELLIIAIVLIGLIVAYFIVAAFTAGCANVLVDSIAERAAQKLRDEQQD